MSIRLSLLAILDQGPCYGNQLKLEFDRRTGATWPLNAGQIYSTLDRLERDGLVTKRAQGTEGQIYYEITGLGRADVAYWLQSAVPRGEPARSEVVMKVAIAATLPGADAPAIILAQRDATERALVGLRSARETLDGDSERNTSEDLARALILDSHIVEAEAELRWLANSGAAIAAAVEIGHAGPVPLAESLPKRGRPARRGDVTGKDDSPSA